ncbi:MAG: SDR family NAD(P)-dependent oxidoreductase, partial [Candidatus Eisenbacteria bacterium]|nr:SDR family NAD(P)-dependent oxidoreductase [Candidatus Eisenbacteria bacterium]
MSETQAMPEQVTPKDLAGQVMFVTGGATGIGLAVARRLAAGGATVAIFNRNQERAEAAVQGILAAGHTAHAFSADIAKTESVDAAFAAALEKLGRVDGLVNNAGLTRDGLFMRMSDAQWEEVINTNLGGAFRCCRA